MKTETTNPVISQEQLLAHWQGHRALTRKVIEAFPEEDLFNFSIGGMRPFKDLAMEMQCLAFYGMEGAVTGQWAGFDKMSYNTGENTPKTKTELLTLWDTTTEHINSLWDKLTPARFQETDNSFNTYEGTVYSFILYWIDNEIHHRGQGYVYLRALGITPPGFWERY